ncbi:adenylate kinase 7-like isoform 4-T4 [Spinachia spinachia]
MGDKKQHTRPKRLFINDVDRYSSMHIAEFLSTSRVGEEDSEEDEAEAAGEAAFQIVGTVSPSSKDADGDFLLEKYSSSTRDELLERLLQCDVVVYNISESATQQQVEEVTWAITALSAEMENFKTRKMFILVSSVMTWAMSKPQNLEESDVLLTEEQFRRRRPHPDFRKHYNVEKVVLELARGKKSKLVGYVVASGLQYGKGENLFNYFFKESWLMQCAKVPLFGKGTNHIPMIHVNDLAGVIQNIVEHKPKSRYILAVDDSKNTLEDIVKVISATLGSGKINKLPQQEAIAMKAFQPGELEYLNINLSLDAFIIKDSFSLHWTSEAGMVENMQSIVEEYKDTRQLLPIRICLVGPPAVGKTTIAEKLCSHYKIHHIRIKEVIEENITRLKEIVNGSDPEMFSEEVVTAAQKQLEQINKSMEMDQEVTTDDLLYTVVMPKIFKIVGVPKNYGPSPEELEEEDRKRDAERKQKVTEEAAARKRRNQAALAEMAAQYEEWQRNLSELERQEHELLEAHSLPLRNYLMKYVMPPLSDAMLDCSKIKPEEPVEFLAEHLLRSNNDT